MKDVLGLDSYILIDNTGYESVFLVMSENKVTNFLDLRL